MNDRVWFCCLLVILTGATRMASGSALFDVESGQTDDAQRILERGGMAAGIGVLRGASIFRIGGVFTDAEGSTGVLPFPLSELDYPLDVVMLRLYGSHRLGRRWAVEGMLGRHLTSDAGQTRDSDWGVLTGPRTLDIYSESDTDLAAWDVRAALRFRVRDASRWALDLTGGYRLQSFDMVNRNLRQVYPSFPEWPADLAPGLVSTYRVRYAMPYVGAVACLRVCERWMLESGITLSPVASARDRGHWVLRDKTFRGRADGSSIGLTLLARRMLGRQGFLQFSMEALAVRTDGSQHQDNIGRIALEIESHQVHALLQAGRFF